MLKEAEAAELVVEQDPIASILEQRAAAGKHWQEQARTLMASLKVLFKTRTCHMLPGCVQVLYKPTSMT